MRQLRQILLGITVLFPLVAVSAPFPVAKVSYLEELTYTAKILGKTAASDIEEGTFAQQALRREMPTRVEVRIERKDISGKKIIVYTRTEYLTNRNIARWQFVLDVGEYLVMRSLKKRIVTGGGVLVREEFINFRAPGLGYPDDLMHAFVIELAMRGVDFNPGYRNSFPTYLTSINIINMDIKILGREEVKVPAGTFECWKVEMMPHLADWVGRIVANLLRAFTPNYIFWFNVDANHHLVKYQGILGAIGAPVQVLELSGISCCDVNSREIAPLP